MAFTNPLRALMMQALPFSSQAKAAKTVSSSIEQVQHSHPLPCSPFPIGFPLVSPSTDSPTGKITDQLCVDMLEACTLAWSPIKAGLTSLTHSIFGVLW